MKTIEQKVSATLAFAKTLFTRGTDAFGAEEIRIVFGITHGDVPPIPFTEEELIRARELGQYLILQVNVGKDSQPLTMRSMHDQFGNKLGDGKLLYNIDWYKGERFFTKDVPRAEWRLVSREVIPGSTSANYIEQTQSIVDYLVGEVYKGQGLPTAYKVAVDEFAEQKKELEALKGFDWKKCAEICAQLKINQLFREKPVEVFYGLIVQHVVNNEYLLGGMYTWTVIRSSLGYLVYVGNADADGVLVRSDGPGYSCPRLGVRFSRGVVPNLES